MRLGPLRFDLRFDIPETAYLFGIPKEREHHLIQVQAEMFELLSAC